jgi:hypothetical protein
MSFSIRKIGMLKMPKIAMLSTPLPWPSPASLDGADDLNLVLFGILVGFHFAPPDTSLSVLGLLYQCVVGLTITLSIRDLAMLSTNCDAVYSTDSYVLTIK